MAAVTSDGKVHVFDLAENKVIALILSIIIYANRPMSAEESILSKSKQNPSVGV